MMYNFFFIFCALLDFFHARPESELIKKIVEDVLKKLNSIHLEDDVMGRRYKKIENLMCVTSSKPLRMIGIWETGGIGKTTLSRIVFQHLYSDFDACFFVEDIRVEWEQGRISTTIPKTLFSIWPGKRLIDLAREVESSQRLETC